MRCLVIEDDVLVARYWQMLLGEQGAEAVLCAGCVDAARRLSADRFDLAIAELTLPDGDGLELATLAAERQPHLPMVIVTGRTDVEGDALHAHFPNVAAVFRKSSSLIDASAFIESFSTRLRQRSSDQRAVNRHPTSVSNPGQAC